MSNEHLLQNSVARSFYGNFTSLYQIQDLAIPHILNGKNVILSSGTGSGKTEAIMAPLISRYLKTAIETDSLTILYIAPTKALVNDLERRLFPYLNKLHLRLGVRHGDHDDMKLDQVPHILITTPESLDVMLFRGDEALKSICAVVIDEIHLVYNTQRGLHLSILLQRLKQNFEKPLQWAAISATMGKLNYIRDFFFGPDEEVEFLKDSTNRKIDAQIRILYSLQDLQDIFVKLFKANNERGKFLTFANSRRECEQIADCLSENQNLKPVVFAHYSSLSTEVRNDVESLFNQSAKAICIATSTLELGIDIGDIDAVFLYGPPSGIESFLQRIGRSNRRLKMTNVICLTRPDCENPYFESLIFHAFVDLAREGILPKRKPYELFGSAAQQALSYIGSVDGAFTRTADLANTCKHLSHLDRKTLELILECLAEKDYLKPHGFKNRYGAGDNLYKLIDYRIIYGNFPAASQQVSVFYGKKILGSVPSINLLRINRGINIRFAGKKWQVKKAQSDGIEVILSNNQNPRLDMMYFGKSGGLDLFILNAMLQLIQKNNFEFDIYAKADRSDISNVVTYLNKIIPKNSIPFIKMNGKYIYLTFAGSLVNKAIALISNQCDFEIDDLKLTCPYKINWESIPIEPTNYAGIFEHLFESDSDHTIYQSLLPESLQKREFLQTWLKDFTIQEQLKRLQNSKSIEVPYFDYL